MRVIKIYAFSNYLIYELRMGIAFFFFEVQLGKITTCKVDINIPQHVHYSLLSCAPMTHFFFSPIKPLLSVKIHLSSCCCFLLAWTLASRSRCEPHLLLGALSVLFGSQVAACPLAHWMEGCASPSFYSSVCGDQAQQHLEPNTLT